MNCERKWVGARRGIKCAKELLRFVSGRTHAGSFRTSSPLFDLCNNSWGNGYLLVVQL